jgi:hypothetical protein
MLATMISAPGLLPSRRKLGHHASRRTGLMVVLGQPKRMIACSLGRRSYLWHESLTIFTSVIVRCPCSESSFFMPLSGAIEEMI